MRESEINNVHYHFIDMRTFNAMIEQDEFVEWAKIYDHRSGTSKAAIEKILKNKQIPILNLDWQGAQSVRSIYGNQVLSIFILPPNLTELERRLKARGDSPASIERRLASAEAEIAHAEEYDHVIVNDTFEHALQELQNLITFCNPAKIC